MINMLTIMCTGHEPDKMYGYNMADKHYKALRIKVQEELLRIMDASQEKKFHIISGMSQGFEQVFFWAAVNAKKMRPDYFVILEATIPCTRQDELWQPEAQRLYNRLLRYAVKLNVIHTQCTNQCIKECMLDSNNYMIENSQIVVAYYNGDQSGSTAYIINKAKAKHAKIINLYNKLNGEILNNAKEN